MPRNRRQTRRRQTRRRRNRRTSRRYRMRGGDDERIYNYSLYANFTDDVTAAFDKVMNDLADTYKGNISKPWEGAHITVAYGPGIKAPTKEITSVAEVDTVYPGLTAFVNSMDTPTATPITVNWFTLREDNKPEGAITGYVLKIALTVSAGLNELRGLTRALPNVDAMMTSQEKRDGKEERDPTYMWAHSTLGSFKPEVGEAKVKAIAEEAKEQLKRVLGKTIPIKNIEVITAENDTHLTVRTFDAAGSAAAGGGS